MDLQTNIAKIMTADVICFTKNENLKKIVDSMKKKNISTVLIIDGGDISGIITERDLVHKVLKYNKDMDKLVAKDIMTNAPLVTIQPQKTINEAMKLMKKYRVKSLPVVISGGDCTGFITQTDIIRNLAD